MAGRLTRVHHRMLKILADGKPHSREELHSCLVDELGSVGTIRQHLHTMRKLLPKDEEIVCVGYYIYKRPPDTPLPDPAPAD